MMRLWTSILLLPSLFLISCAYQPEDAGQCKLVCGSAIIGANDPSMSIKLKSAVPETTCTAAAAGQPITNGYRTSFLIGESILDQSGEEVAVRPVPNISVEPVIIGGVATIEGGDPDPKYAGIKTPRSNWCSDACGVVSIDFVPLCPGLGLKTEVTVQLHSGALFSEPAAFPISTEDPAAAAGP